MIAHAGIRQQLLADEEMAQIDRAAVLRESRADDRELGAELRQQASATGPILPASVELKVEQYLKKILPRAGLLAASRQAASDCATASAAGIVRDFSATTMASASGSGSPVAGTPITCTVRMPPRTSVLARSVAPVRSSAMQPSSEPRSPPHAG